MAKFVIECPSCGKFAEARSGFFARKKVDCACGHTINIRTEKLSSRKCPHCGNEVVFDQSKGEKAKCPVCHEPINTMVESSKTIEFSCKQCGVRHRTAKTATTYTCPVCDFENDVAERTKSEEIRRDGLASVIKYEGDGETLVWKHPIEDFNLGSQLIVHESQEAIFFRDGQALDLFGPGRYTLETQSIPILEKAYKLPTDNEGTFHSEVYFINLTTQMGIKWGTDTKVRLFDPMTGMHVEIGASGEFGIRVLNSRKFLLKVVGTTGGFHQDQLFGGSAAGVSYQATAKVEQGNNQKSVSVTEQLKAVGGKGYFRGLVMTQVKSFLAAAIRERNISVLEIDERLLELSEALRDKINARLEEYGLEMPEFFVVRVLLPDEDPNFRRVKEQFAEQYLGVRQEQILKNVAMAAAERKAVEAQTDAQIKLIGAQADADAYRMKAAAEAEEMRMKGYTYQQETARQVGLEAMQNGLTGGGSSGLGDVAGLGVALGAMGSVMGMTKDALNPMMNAGFQAGQTIGSAGDTWDCACGNKGITMAFCGACGAKKPEPQKLDAWDCACGNKGITMKFCGQCGAKRPEPQKPDTWDCACGNKGITMKFCGECGAKKPEPQKPDTWECACGQKAITTGFCPNCGTKKE